MKKLTRAFAVSASILAVTGCSMGHDYRIAEEDMASSIDTFNQYCTAMQAKDLMAFGESGSKSVFDEKTHLGRESDFKNANTVPLASYDDLEKGGYDLIMCQRMPRSTASSFKFPDLSNIKPTISFFKIEGPVDFVPEGMEVRAFAVKSRNTPAVSTAISKLSYVKTESPLVFGAHIYVERADGFGLFPEKLNTKLDGEPLTVRLDDDSLTDFGALSRVSEAKLYFNNNADTPDGDEKMPKSSAFCENYGNGTNAYIVGSSPILTKEPKQLSKSEVCI